MDDFTIVANSVLDDGMTRARVKVTGGVIDSIEKLQTEISESLVLFPGFIDVHVHAREYALPSNSDKAQKLSWERMTAKETFQTAGRAAINGGVVLFAAMPNDPVPPDNEKTYGSKLKVANTSACPVIVFSCITRNSAPWADIPYKLYLDHGHSDNSFSYWEDVETSLRRYSCRSVFFHAEDPVILHKNSHLSERFKSRPPEAEVSAVRQILELTSKYSIKSHICHISTTEAVELIKDYNKISSRKVTCEVTPHHLFFSASDHQILGDGLEVDGSRFLFECNPPLRSEHDRNRLLDALKCGDIDMVASDHAPHTLEDKFKGAPGIPHLDTYGAFASWLVKKHAFSCEKIAEIFSRAPATLMSDFIEGEFGSLKPGKPANMTLLDLSGKTMVEGSMIRNRGPLQTKCAWSAFDGIELPGSVCKVVSNGRVTCFDQSS